MQLWEVDLVGPLPITERRNKYIVTIIDHYTRWAYAFPIKNKSSEETLECIKEAIKKEGAKPRRILTDNGLEFANAEFIRMAAEQGIELRKGSPYHPQTTGSIERLNKTLIGKLKKITDYGIKEWDMQLHYAVKAYNISKSRPLGMSPFEFKLKKIPIFTIDNELIGCVEDNRIKEKEIKKARRTLGIYKKSYGTNKENKYKLGDKVLYYNPVARVNKLESRWQEKGKFIKADKGSYLFVTNEGVLR
jgi:transposase InsO family protein